MPISKAGSIPIVIGEGSPFPSSHTAGRTGACRDLAGYSRENVQLDQRRFGRVTTSKRGNDYCTNRFINGLFGCWQPEHNISADAKVSIAKQIRM